MLRRQTLMLDIEGLRGNMTHEDYARWLAVQRGSLPTTPCSDDGAEDSTGEVNKVMPTTSPTTPKFGLPLSRRTSRNASFETINEEEEEGAQSTSSEQLAIEGLMAQCFATPTLCKEKEARKRHKNN